MTNGLTRQITLMKKTTTQDAELTQTRAQVEWRTVWAEPVSETSREFYRLARQNAEITHVFKIRYIAGITAHQGVRFNGETLEIVGKPVNLKEQNRWLYITCKGAV